MLEAALLDETGAARLRMPGICCPGAPVDPTSIEAADGDKRRCLVAVFAALLVEVAIADVDAAIAGAATPGVI